MSNFRAKHIRLLHYSLHLFLPEVTVWYYVLYTKPVEYKNFMHLKWLFAVPTLLFKHIYCELNVPTLPIYLK